MKNSNKNIKKRRQQIIVLLEQSAKKTLSVNELAETLEVSSMTMRRDLDTLEKMGQLKRHHGVATLSEPIHFEGTTESEQLELNKQQIAKVAASHIEDNMTVFVNSSSTALESMVHTQAQNLTIISNNTQIAHKRIPLHSTVILTGGELRIPKEVLVGTLAIETLSGFNSDIAIIGCSGISADKGISTHNIHESKLNEIMINHTNRTVIVVADYRKIGNDSNFVVSSLYKIDILITDRYADQDELNKMEELGVTVIQAYIP